MIDSAQPDLYSLNVVPEKVDETTRQQLVQKARNFKVQQQKLKDSQFFSHEYYYLISVKFLTRWKVYVSFEQSNNSMPMGKLFGSGKLPIINQDIVESVNKFDVQFGRNLSELNVVLKPGLQQGKDYVFATEQMWEAIIRGVDKSDYIQIKRKVIQSKDGKKVQLYYQKLTIVPSCNRILKDVQYQTKSTLISYTLQFSRYATIEQLKQTIKQQISNKLPFQYSCKMEKGLPTKLWLAAEKTQKKVLFNTFMQGCKANSTFSYRLFFQGDKMVQDKTLNDYDILDDSLIVMQYKEQKTDWCFFNKVNMLVSSCSYCRSIQKLEYLCSCKYVAYCSKQCKIRDRSSHQGRCPNNAQSQQQEKQLTQTQNSRRGVVGLRNLGNTCFMNSGLQCLSHVVDLTQYFLTNKYIADINKDNPLGTKGQLCIAYAKLLKSLWYGTDTSVSPTQLKRAIGKFQSMFSGYNQHDSGQLITYLLDGLHQDLNRVKVKPYVQSKDYDGRPDNIVAVQQWEHFLLRNRSQIVDLMYGQYRSVVDCPKCNQRSIQFDPFCMCSLPIINSSLKKIQITYLQNYLTMYKLQVCFDKAWNWTMKDVSQQVKKKINKPNANLVFYVASYSSCQQIDINRKVNQVRSQYKYRTLYVRELQKDEKSKQSIKITLGNTICHTYYKDQSYRKNVTPYRMHFLDQNLTLKQVHHKLYSYYKEVIHFQNYEEEVIKIQKDDRPLKLLSIPTSRYSQCQYCAKKSCDGCQIPYNDNTLKSFVSQMDKQKIQFQLYWRKNDKEVQKKFDQSSQGKTEKQNQVNKSKGQTTLQDCLRLFSEPETLAQDNAYFCPKCKDLVLAKKQMQIYKAPKVLVLCLKRFKRKQYYQQKYSILIDFPIQGLDMSQFVINKNLPTHQISQQQYQYHDGPLLYDLFAISNHFGSTGGGHYTAFCKNPLTGRWYDCDDSSVSQMNKKSDLVTQSAYILFYKRRE